MAYQKFFDILNLFGTISYLYRPGKYCCTCFG